MLRTIAIDDNNLNVEESLDEMYKKKYQINQNNVSTNGKIIGPNDQNKWPT